TLKAGLPAPPPWPDGAVSAEQAVVDVAGLRIAGLGGCRRYSDGPNQYTRRQQARRARALSRRARWRGPPHPPAPPPPPAAAPPRRRRGGAAAAGIPRRGYSGPAAGPRAAPARLCCSRAPPPPTRPRPGPIVSGPPSCAT